MGNAGYFECPYCKAFLRRGTAAIPSIILSVSRVSTVRLQACCYYTIATYRRGYSQRYIVLTVLCACQAVTLLLLYHELYMAECHILTKRKLVYRIISAHKKRERIMSLFFVGTNLSRPDPGINNFITCPAVLKKTAGLFYLTKFPINRNKQKQKIHNIETCAFPLRETDKHTYNLSLS